MPDRLDLDALHAEAIARAFHEAYEQLAPRFAYETRPASAVPWEQVPENNRALMVATVGEILPGLIAAARERDQLRWERQAVIDAVNLYGDDLIHSALDDIGFAPRKKEAPDA